ncbi:unnamed protein product [Mytilus edulis]|uniref:C-type lectin domain-containing protein n=1 Tax=Mytilus edulis TaxID=6550 RepID=A0A8S3RY60_MYTED|nr:unnamed protein product [Mytilus edulis]
MGGNDLKEEGDWRWMNDLSKVNFTSWSLGEPNDYGGGEDCAHFRLTKNYQWNDMPCTTEDGDNKPNIIGITEVKPKANRYKPSTAEYSIPEVGNYKVFEKNIKSDEGRDLLMYVDSNLEATEITMKTEFQENIFIKVKLNQNDKLLVGLIYRTPSNSSKEHNDKLVNLMSEATDMGYSHILIMGDFDYPEINWETWNTKGDRPNSIENKFLEALQDNFLYQHTTKLTRWRGADTPHTLDLLITNEEEMISNLEYMSPLGKSDHCVLSFDFNCYVNIKRAPRIANLYNHGNYKDFIQELNKIDWHNKFNAENSIDKNWNYFLTILKELEGRFVPTKTMTQIGKKRNVFPIDKKTRDVFTNEPQGNIPEPKHIPLDKNIEELNIGTDLVLTHLQKIKTDKSAGPDNLHPRLLFEVKEGIAEPLGIIFSQSLIQKVVPKDWKSALVSAIFQKGNKSQAKNYRPVSLTSVVCKIMEKIIREHIISYMKENKLFSNKQYGFISGRSTSLQLLECRCTKQRKSAGE